MAYQEHLELLKQGVTQWNEWRRQIPDKPFTRHGAYPMSDAELRDARMNSVVLSGVGVLRALDLRGADLCGANLSFANLFGADLSFAYLGHTKLRDANMNSARADRTVFVNLDLRTVKGLASIQHAGPSPAALYTIQLPQDGNALQFLRGTGIPDEWIDDYRARMMHPIQYHSLFISYSNKDETLARRLYADLQARGVRCWFAPEDLKIGDRFHPCINEAIHLQDKLLLLLSESAIQSDWVESEVRVALEKEQHQHRDVLFPVCLDSSVMETSQAWAAMLRQSRHIGDFTLWTDPQAYQVAFTRLLDDLKKTDERQDQEMEQ